MVLDINGVPERLPKPRQQLTLLTLASAHPAPQRHLSHHLRAAGDVVLQINGVSERLPEPLQQLVLLALADVPFMSAKSRPLHLCSAGDEER